MEKQINIMVDVELYEKYKERVEHKYKITLFNKELFEKAIKLWMKTNDSIFTGY
jgi:hypothetical protein